jgi:hypothetical protein
MAGFWWWVSEAVAVMKNHSDAQKSQPIKVLCEAAAICKRPTCLDIVKRYITYIRATESRVSQFLGLGEAIKSSKHAEQRICLGE